MSKYYLPLIGLLLVGCVGVNTVQTDESWEQDGITYRKIVTKGNAKALLAAKQALDKVKLTQTDKSQGLSVGSVSQESDASSLVRAAAEGAAKGALGKP